MGKITNFTPLKVLKLEERARTRPHHRLFLGWIAKQCRSEPQTPASLEQPCGIQLSARGHTPAPGATPQRRSQNLPRLRVGQRALGLRWERGTAGSWGHQDFGSEPGSEGEYWESVGEAGGQQAGARGQEQPLPGVMGSAGVAELVEWSLWGELRGLALAPCPPCPGPPSPTVQVLKVARILQPRWAPPAWALAVSPAGESSEACVFAMNPGRQLGQGQEQALGQSGGPTSSHPDYGATSPALP